MSADLQELFDQAGRNPPAPALEADAVLRRARRSHHRRITGVAAVAVAVTLALAVGLASQLNRTAAPDPAVPRPPTPALGSLGRLAFGLDGDIYVANADGRNRVRIVDGAPGAEGDCPTYWGEGPIWSPDGRHLAVRGDIATGGDTPTGDCSWNRTVNIIDPSGQRIASFPGDGWGISWSPDSSRVAAWIDFYGEHTLGIYGLDGARQALLTVPPEIMTPGDWDPIWSPDGDTLLGPNGLEIPVDGSAPRQLPGGDPRSNPWYAYSSGGANIAYITGGGLAVSAADGSEARMLVPGALGPTWWSMGPVWSPTGDHIAFRSQASGENELAMLDVTRGTVVPLATMGGGANSVNHIVKFSPDGHQILFVKTDATDARSLWSIRTDGSDLRRLVAGSDWGDWERLPTR